MEVHIYISNPNFPEMETGESDEWQSWLLSDLEATFGIQETYVKKRDL